MSGAIKINHKIVALSAARLLRERGWVQGEPMTEDGRMCLIGSIHQAIAEMPEAANYRDLEPWMRSCLPLISRTFQALRNHLCIEKGSLVTWNDNPGRTASEVIAALEAVGGVK